MRIHVICRDRDTEFMFYDCLAYNKAACAGYFGRCWDAVVTGLPYTDKEEKTDAKEEAQDITA